MGFWGDLRVFSISRFSGCKFLLGPTRWLCSDRGHVRRFHGEYHWCPWRFMDALGVNFPTSRGSESLRLTSLMEFSEPVHGMISEFVGPVDPNKRLRVYIYICNDKSHYLIVFIHVFHVSSSFCIGSTWTFYSQKEYLIIRLGSSSSAIVIEFSPTCRCFLWGTICLPTLKFNNSPLKSYRSTQ